MTVEVTGAAAAGERASDPDLLYSEAEEDLRAAVRSLLAARAEPAAILGRIETGDPYDPALWRALATDMGTAGLLVPEKLGGQGASAREAAVVLEELGRAAVPAPYLTSAVLVVETLLGCEPEASEEPEVARLLASFASGRTVGALALPLPTGPGSALSCEVRVAADGTLEGGARRVADAAGAHTLLVPARGPEGVELYAVDASAAGVTVSPLVSLDLTRPLADVAFAGVRGRRLAGPGVAEAAVRRALLAGAGLLASEQLGVAEWCLSETVRHMGERKQFNRPVGSFQALKHRLARLWLDIVSARATARYAADALASGSADAPVAVAVAQSACSKAAVRAAEECVQLHGGIGMTWEHPVHLYLKRAKTDEIALGTPSHHRETLAELVNLPSPTAG
ncbi:acyl-CoA dehydrogenase family protein [Streptomyces pathocidini]|uniref:acyl-CoA dehydrogenase family protein n=1 Tax=Streptomyces pathocidini TaxID=1650571 RepID=UPI0033D377C5